jgi:hypothetical protein
MPAHAGENGGAYAVLTPAAERLGRKSIPVQPNLLYRQIAAASIPEPGTRST